MRTGITHAPEGVKTNLPRRGLRALRLLVGVRKASRLPAELRRSNFEVAANKPVNGSEADAAALLHDLRKRERELAALHALEKILATASGPLPGLLRQIVALLPPVGEHPERAVGRIVLGKLRVATGTCAGARWVQRARFCLRDGTRGVVEAGYLRPRPDEAEGPLLAEERNLMSSVAGALKMFLDHRRTEEQLRQSEARFHRALRHSPITVFNQDKQLRYTWVCNPKAPQRTPFRPGKTDEALFRPQEARVLRRIKRRVLQTGKNLRDEVRVTQGGRAVFYDLALEPLRDSAGRIVGITGAAMDITRRKQAEAERSFMASIVESSEDAIFVRTLGGGIVTWNAGAERMFGYSATEAVGQPVSILVPADRAEEVSRISARIKRGERMEHYETVRLRKDGGQIHVSLTNSPMRSAEGPVTGVSTIARDITRRKQLELEILEINEILQRRVGQDLHDGLSQELRGIAYLSHALQQSLLAKGSPEAHIATRITDLLQRTLTQARDLARGLAPLRLEADGLMAALRELAAATKSIYDIRCTFACPRAVLVPNRSTAIHLYRIAQEAVQNAIKHGNPKRIVIELGRSGARVMLTILDDGKGLPTHLEKCSGIGLKTMDYRARTIGGVLNLDRVEEGGTRVRCILPMATRNPLVSRASKPESLH